MKIRITESQYRTLVNKPRDVVFGNIYEGRGPRETPEEIDAKIEEILNHVKNGGEFIRVRAKDDKYKWLYNKKKSDKTGKFQNVFNQINEIQEELENKKIEKILNHVKNGGEFKRDNKDNNYLWLYTKKLYDKTGKFQNVLDQIKKIQEELENKKIEEILNHVKNGGELTRVTYIWLHNNKKSDKTGKFQNVLDQIKKNQEELENKKIKKILNHVKNGGEFVRIARNPYYQWLYNKSQTDKTEEQKFQNALNQISEIQAKLGIKREWWGERTIKDILIGMGFENIPQQGQHIYKDCRNSLTCKLYKFDIYLPYNENNYMVGKDKDFYIPKTGIIFEYDGIQHFQLNEHFGGEEEFIKRIHSDKEKNSYCKNNDIKLVRIPYTTNTYHEINHAVFYGLKSKNTNGNIILTGDYPQLGWNQK
jgi:hypothetical protein